jgi:hypothetical protein
MATATYDLIASQTLGSAASSITFSSIAASWTDLRLVFVGTGNTAGMSVLLQFNGDTATNYSITELWGDGTNIFSGSGINRTLITLTYADGLRTSVPSFRTADIFSYAGSTYKTVLTTESSDFNGSGSVCRTVQLWRSTSAITSIYVFSSSTFTFSSGTTAQLYGIKAA